VVGARQEMTAVTTEPRLFDGIDPRKVALEIEQAIHAPQVTHLRYAVRGR
jgi:hypothetical protein